MITTKFSQLPVIAFVFFIMSIVLLISSFAFYKFAPEPYLPLLGEYESPRRILSRSSVEGPSVIERGMISYVGNYCTFGKETIQVKVYITFRSITTDGSIPRQVSAGNYGKSEARAPGGCFTPDIFIVVPETIMPGKWEIVGVEIADKSGELRTWYTESFQVLPR